MKRIYLEAYCATNFGDDLFVRILTQRYPNVQFYLNCSRFDDKAFKSIPNITIMNRTHFKGMLINNVKRIMNNLKIDVKFPYDGQVYIGGSIFPEPDGYPDNQDYFRFMEQRKQSSTLPYFIMGANFGPYLHNEFIEYVRNFIQDKVNGICFRDRYSYETFKELPQVRYAPDIVFSLGVKEKKQENLILITVIYHDDRCEIDDFNNESYIGKMADLVNYYHQLNKEVILLSFCNHQHDHIVCQKINERTKKASKVVCYQGNLDEIIDLFERCEYIISTRFHSMILALSANKPVFPISYSNKTANVLKDLDYQGKYCHINQFPDLSLEEIDYNRIHITKIDLKTIKEDVNNQFQQFETWLNGGGII